MKEFEKWETQKCRDSDCCYTRAACSECRAYRKEGWIAALEWFKELLIELNKDEVVVLIKEELGDVTAKETEYSCVAPEFRIHIGCKDCEQPNCKVREEKWKS